MKRRLTLLLLIISLISALFMLTACDGDIPLGEWLSDEGEPDEDIGEVGDFYFDKESFDVYQKTEAGWSYITTVELPDDLPDSPDTPDNPSDNTPTTPKVDVYIGYDGYLFANDKPTGISLDRQEQDGVIEDTTLIMGAMSKHFPTKYLDLSASYAALMPYYNQSRSATFYSGSTVTEIWVHARSSGKINIGTAKISDIVNNKTNPSALSLRSSASYTVSAGLNKITLTTPLSVPFNSTVVLGGNGSVSLAYSSGIPLSDEQGHFASIGADASQTLIASSDGRNADKLYVKVVFDEDSLYESAIIDDTVTRFDVASLSNVVTGNTPYVYKNIHREFSGKRLTEIGIPVRKVSAIDDNQTFTFYVFKMKIKGDKINLDQTDSKKEGTAYTVKLPKDQLGNNKDAVNKYVYVDLTPYNIVVKYDQSLAFGKSDDTVTWGWANPGITNTAKYAFSSNATVAFNDTWAEGTPTSGLVFDVRVREAEVFDERMDRLASDKELTVGEKANLAMKAMKSAGKSDISFLGDSITTMSNYSNGSAADTTNSTIAKNVVWYGSGRYEVLSVYDTWWYQGLTSTGLKLLVNNSWSGDKLSENKSNPENSGKGLERCVQLHDDTGSNAGTNPDIITVFFGTNDEGIPLADFKPLYTQMLDKIKNKYPDADIFVLTLLQRSESATQQAKVASFNDAIKEIASAKGAFVVDIAEESGITRYNYIEYTLDGTHPNKAGMDLITNCFIDALYEKYAVGN